MLLCNKTVFLLIVNNGLAAASNQGSVRRSAALGALQDKARSPNRRRKERKRPRGLASSDTVNQPAMAEHEA
jgi:hypothetical protein